MPKGSNRIAIGQANLAILRGDEDVSLWSDEEIERGQRRDKNGNWSGRRPVIVPTAIHDERMRRTYTKATAQLNGSVQRAVATMAGLLNDPDPNVRFKAAKFIVEQVIGKTPERISLNVAVKSKWEEALETSIVSMAQLEDAAIVAFATEIEDEEDDPFA